MKWDKDWEIWSVTSIVRAKLIRSSASPLPKENLCTKRCESKLRRRSVTISSRRDELMKNRETRSRRSRMTGREAEGDAAPLSEHVAIQSIQV